MSQSKELFYNTVGNFTTLFFQWLIIMLIPKIGNFADAGIFAIALSICSIMNVVITFSIYNHQLYDKYESYTESDYYTFRIFTTIISIILCAIIVVSLGYNVKECAVVFSYLIYRIIISFMILHTTRMQIEERLDLVGKCMIVEGIVSFLCFIITYWLTVDLFASTLIMALIGGSSYIMTITYCFKKVMGRRYESSPMNKSVIPKLFGIGLLLTIPQLVINIIPSVSKIGLQLFTDNTMAGIFSTISSPTVVIQVFVSAMFAPFVIKFSEYYKNNQMREFKKSYMATVALILAIGLAGIIASVLFAKFFFNLLYGNKVDDYIYLFNWMIVAIVFMSIANCAITVLAMENRKKIAAISSIISLIASMILFGIMIPSGGINGTANALVASNIIFAIVTSIPIMINAKDDDGHYKKQTENEK